MGKKQRITELEAKVAELEQRIAWLEMTQPSTITIPSIPTVPDIPVWPMWDRDSSAGWRAPVGPIITCGAGTSKAGHWD